MKSKLMKLLKVLAVAVIAVVLILAVEICVTEINAKKIPHRYASAEEGRSLVLANTEYYDQYTQNDIDMRMKKSGATIEELLDATEDAVGDFNLFEKLYIDHRIAKMYKVLKKNHYTLPEIDEIVFVNIDMELEGGATGYTHGTEIFLNDASVAIYSILRFIPGFSSYMDELLWHEMFHCLTRCNPEFRTEMYSLIHFTVADSDFEMPPCVSEKYLSNPDVEHHNSYATFQIDGQEIDCYVVWIKTQSYAESGAGWGDCEAVALVPIDGTDTYYLSDQATNFDEVFGTNTYYVIDPEECMADNFAYAMNYGIKGEGGKGYPNPEIIQGIIDYVSK